VKFPRLLPFILFFLSAQISFAQLTEKWSLEKCVSYAVENNLTIRQSAINANISSKNDLQSKLNLLPSIDANGSFSDNFGNGFNPQTYSFAEGTSQSFQGVIQANWTLFTGLQQLNNVQKARYDLLASKYDYENAKNNIILSVASDYLQILLNKEIEQVAEQQRGLTAAQEETIKERIKAGALPETSIYDIESQLGRDEVNIVTNKNTVYLSILALEQLLQLIPSDSFDVETPMVSTDNLADLNTLSAHSVYEFAVETQPSILGADARVKSADASRKATIGSVSPTLSAFATLSSGYFSQDVKVLGYTYDTLAGIAIPTGENTTKTTFFDDLKTNFRTSVGLSLDIPLFSRGQKVLNIQKSKLQEQINELQLETAKNQLRQDIEQAYANAKAAAESYLANKKSLEASQKAYDATDIRYKAGMASNFDMQQTKNNLLSAESQMIQAKYTYVFRLKILDFYQGKPITLN